MKMGKILCQVMMSVVRKESDGDSRGWRGSGKHPGIRRPWAEAAKNEPGVFAQHPRQGWLELSGWEEGSRRGWSREAVGEGHEEPCRTLSESEFDSERAGVSLRDWLWEPCDRTQILRGSLRLPTKVHLVKALVFPVVMYGCEGWTIKKKLSAKELILLNCGVGEDSWESLGLQGDPASPS